MIADAADGSIRSLHGSCVARSDSGVLLLGQAGCGKSDLALRLMDRGFALVADDRVLVEDGLASAPSSLAGLIEVRGLGLLRVPFRASVGLKLVVLLDGPIERLPVPARHPSFDLPQIKVMPFAQSAPLLVEIALDCLDGVATIEVGAIMSCV